MINAFAHTSVTAGDAHDALRGVSAWSAFGAIIIVLVSAVATLLLLVRRSDLKVVERAELALNSLVEEIAAFRRDLQATREQFLREYATKSEMLHLERKLERLHEHCTIRGAERRLVEDSEDGG